MARFPNRSVVLVLSLSAAAFVVAALGAERNASEIPPLIESVDVEVVNVDV